MVLQAAVIRIERDSTCPTLSWISLAILFRSRQCSSNKSRNPVFLEVPCFFQKEEAYVPHCHPGSDENPGKEPDIFRHRAREKMRERNQKSQADKELPEIY